MSTGENNAPPFGDGDLFAEGILLSGPIQEAFEIVAKWVQDNYGPLTQFMAFNDYEGVYVACEDGRTLSESKWSGRTDIAEAEDSDGCKRSLGPALSLYFEAHHMLASATKSCWFNVSELVWGAILYGWAVKALSVSGEIPDLRDTPSIRQLKRPAPGK
jgi:hypothetical protein